MASTTSIVLTSSDDLSQIKADALDPQGSAISLGTYLHKLAAGCGHASISIALGEVGAVKASGTVTFASLANNDTVTVGTTVFTAKTSGATGTSQFNLGASDTTAATAFAAAVNSNPAMSGVATASPSAAVTTITAARTGLIGNQIALAISAHGSVSAGHLAGGVATSPVTLHLGA